MALRMDGILRREAMLGSGFVHFSKVPDLDDENDVWGLDGIDNAPIPHTQPPCTLEAVPQGLAKLDGVRGEFVLDGLADPVPDVLGQPWSIFVNDAFQIFDSIAQAQTFLWGILFCFLLSRSSATREK